MRTATLPFGAALLPLAFVLCILCLGPATARAAVPRATAVGAGQLGARGRALPQPNPLLLPRALTALVQPGVRGAERAGWHTGPASHGWLASSVASWVGRSLSPALLIQGPDNASLLTQWLTSGVNRFLSIFSPTGSPTGHGPIAIPTGLALLTVSPVAGAVSSEYGYRRDPIHRRRKFHKGVDFRADRGTPVYAAGPGVVREARRRNGYGRLVVISHGNGVETRYAHLHRIHVERGQFVPAGALIGAVGATGRATGPHLHFEVRRHGEPVDPNRVLSWNSGRGVIAIAP